MKFIEGDIDGIPVVVESKLPIKFKDLLIGGSIIISGIGYLMTKSFRYGSKNCMVAELKTLSDIGKCNPPLTKEEIKKMLNQ